MINVIGTEPSCVCWFSLVGRCNM